jgi:phosphomannomutase
MRVEVRELAASGAAFGTSGVRGKVEALTDRVCFGYAAAFLGHVAPRGPGRTVALGHDLRPSSPRISAACASAAAALGWRVVYLGALPTPAIALRCLELGIPGIVVTGSHIPFDRNGIKFYLPEGEILKADEAAITAAAVDLPDGAFAGDALAAPAPLPPPDPAGLARYAARVLDFFPPGLLRGRRIGLWEHSSVGRDVLREVLSALGAEVVSLGRTDTFVPVDTEAVGEADQAQAHAWARDHRLDALASTDGDADRPLVGDETGTFLRGDVVGLLCAAHLGARTVVTPVSSNSAVDRSGRFERVVRTRIGSPYVIEAMERAAREGGGPVAGYEANGGFLLGSAVPARGGRTGLAPLPTRDAALPILAVLAIAAERGRPVSSVLEGLPARFTWSDRLQEFPTAEGHALVDRLSRDAGALRAFLEAAGAGPAEGTDRTDGLRVTVTGGEIVHLRPSGNAPELRCYAEADSPGRARALCGAGLRAAAAMAGRG